MSNKIKQMSDFTNNTMAISPEQIIEEFKEFLKENPDFDKVILVALNTKNDRFKHYWAKAKVLNSVGIAVLTLVIDDFIGMLRDSR